MKRILPMIMGILLLTSIAYATTFFLTSSGKITSSQAVTTQRCVFGGILIITDGTNDVTVTIYDHASAASGTAVWESTITGSDNYGGGILPHPIRCENGIYAALSGDGVETVIIYYDLR